MLNDNNSNNDNDLNFWIEFDDISWDQVDKIIKNLDSIKGSSNDINVNIVRLIWECNSNTILYMFRNSLKTGKLPNIWKMSITPIKKIENSINIEDFRPINTLPIMEQVIEEIVKVQLEKFVKKNNILAGEQSGFRKFYSYKTAIQSSLIDWKNSLDEGMFVGIVFIDFARAFETICRGTLLNILEKIGIRGTVFN